MSNPIHTIPPRRFKRPPHPQPAPTWEELLGRR